MEMFQDTCLHRKNIIAQISEYNIFHFLRYAHSRYAKYLFEDMRKQQNTLKSSLLCNKNANLLVCNSRILKIKNAKFLVCCFHMNTNIYGDFQICPLIAIGESFIV